MKVADAIKQMSKLPFAADRPTASRRISRSPTSSRRGDIILRNVEELTDRKRITTVLQFDGPFKDQIRQILMLEAFVNRPDWSASEQGHRRELDPPGARRPRRRRRGRQPALRGS